MDTSRVNRFIALCIVSSVLVFSTPATGAKTREFSPICIWTEPSIASTTNTLELKAVGNEWTTEGIFIRRIGDMTGWHLEFSEINGLRFSQPPMKPVSTIARFEFGKVLRNALICASELNADLDILDIRIGFRVVAEILETIVSESRAAIKDLEGTVHSKNKLLQIRVSDSLSASTDVEKLCSVLREYNFFCEQKVDVMPMAFESDYSGKPWSVLKNTPYFGFHEVMEFKLNNARQSL